MRRRKPLACRPWPADAAEEEDEELLLRVHQQRKQEVEPDREGAGALRVDRVPPGGAAASAWTGGAGRDSSPSSCQAGAVEAAWADDTAAETCWGHSVRR